MSDEILDRLRRLDVSSVADADRSMRVMTGPQRVNPGRRLAGRAFTVRAEGDLYAVLDALQQAGPGQVLVVDAHDSAPAVAGELIATEAQRKGLAGIVVDGVCRDVAGLRRLSLPFYATSSRPDAVGAAVVGALQQPVRCGGVEVRPGDLVLGDDDGLVVLDDDQARRALPLAETIQAREEALVEHMRRGGSLFDHLDLSGVRDGTGPLAWG